MISSAFTSIVVSLGFLKVPELLIFMSPKSAPQFMHLLLIPKDTVPHWLQVFTFDFKELKPISVIKNIKVGIKKISNNTFPTRLIKKLNPKIGITNKKINK